MGGGREEEDKHKDARERGGFLESKGMSFSRLECLSLNMYISIRV